MPINKEVGLQTNLVWMLWQTNFYLGFDFLDSYIAAMWMVTNIPQEFLACTFASVLHM